MVALVAVALLSAATPRPARNADIVVFAPRLDRIDGVAAFFNHAGDYSALLRPGNWAEDAHPFFPLDVTRPASLSALGLSPSGPLTVNLLGDDHVACFEVKEPALVASRTQAALSGIGEIQRGKSGGLAWIGARRGSALSAGSITRGRDVCAFDSARSGEARLKDTTAAIGSPPKNPLLSQALALPGAVFAAVKHVALALSGEANRLNVEGRTDALGVGLSRSSNVYSAMPMEGVLFMRAHVEVGSRDRLAHVVAGWVQQLDPELPRHEVEELAATLSPLMTGDFAVRLDRIEPGSSFRSRPEQLFALKGAALAGLSNVDSARSALGRITRWPGARASDDGFVLRASKGELRVGFVGGQLFVANDQAAAKNLIGKLSPKTAAMKHALELSVEPKAIAHALSRISLADILSSRELAALFAASTELGPLLAASEGIAGWADPAGSDARFHVEWRLSPETDQR